jgi:hypothetical protein
MQASAVAQGNISALLDLTEAALLARAAMAEITTNDKLENSYLFRATPLVQAHFVYCSPLAWFQRSSDLATDGFNCRELQGSDDWTSYSCKDGDTRKAEGELVSRERGAKRFRSEAVLSSWSS